MPLPNSGQLVPDDWEDPFADPTDPNAAGSTASTTGAGAVTFSAQQSNFAQMSMNVQGSGLPIQAIKDRKQRTMFGFNYEFRPPVKGFDDDPYVYRVDFAASLIGKTIAGKPGLMYEVSGKLNCPEFEIEDYMLLRKKHLLWRIAGDRLMGKKLDFEVSAFRWMMQAADDLDPRKDETKEKIKQQFGYYLRSNKPMLENIETAIKAIYGQFEDEIKAAMAEASEQLGVDGKREYLALPQALGLEKEYGTIAKVHTSDIFDYLFGKRWHFFNGDLARVQDGELLVPHYWVNDERHTSRDKGERYLGYGMRSSVVDWALEPYPYVIWRVNRIWSELADEIRKQAAAFNAKKKNAPRVISRDVYIAAMKGERVIMKKLSEKFLTFNEERIDLISSLAIGELESEDTQA